MSRVKQLLAAAKRALARRRASLPPVPPISPNHQVPVGEAPQKGSWLAADSWKRNLPTSGNVVR
jgi:hypothetical protein